MSKISFTEKSFNQKDSITQQYKQAKLLGLSSTEILTILVGSLEDIITYNEVEEIECLINDDSPFFCKDLPDISIYDFLKRIIKYCKIEISTLIIMSMYIDRYSDQCSYFISNYSIYR